MATAASSGSTRRQRQHHRLRRRRIRLPNNINAYYLPNPPSGGDKTQTVQIGELSTSGSGAGVVLGGANGAADRSVHWKVGALNTSTTFGGSIQNRTGPAHFTKLGTGTLTLTGASTYTGATTVSQGGLLVDGSLGNTAVTVATGALLGGDGSFGGPVTASAGSFLSPGTAPFTGATLTARRRAFAERHDVLLRHVEHARRSQRQDRR